MEKTSSRTIGLELCGPHSILLGKYLIAPNRSSSPLSLVSVNQGCPCTGDLPQKIVGFGSPDEALRALIAAADVVAEVRNEFDGPAGTASVINRQCAHRDDYSIEAKLPKLSFLPHGRAAQDPAASESQRLTLRHGNSRDRLNDRRIHHQTESGTRTARVSVLTVRNERPRTKEAKEPRKTAFHSGVRSTAHRFGGCNPNCASPSAAPTTVSGKTCVT